MHVTSIIIITKINTHLRINEVDNSMLKVSSWNILIQVTAIFIREMPVNLLKNNFNQQQQKTHLAEDNSLNHPNNELDSVHTCDL